MLLPWEKYCLIKSGEKKHEGENQLALLILWVSCSNLLSTPHLPCQTFPNFSPLLWVHTVNFIFFFFFGCFWKAALTSFTLFSDFLTLVHLQLNPESHSQAGQGPLVWSTEESSQLSDFIHKAVYQKKWTLVQTKPEGVHYRTKNLKL